MRKLQIYFFKSIVLNIMPTTDAGSGFDLKIQDAEKKRIDSQSGGIPAAPHNFVTPGTVITREPGFMRLHFLTFQSKTSIISVVLKHKLIGYCRGHGTYVVKDGSLVASVCGTVERVNKLVTVKGVGGVYNGEVNLQSSSGLKYFNSCIWE